MHPLSPGTRSAALSAIAKDIFEHLRNLMTCATLLGLGLLARNRSGQMLGGVVLEGTVGWGVIALAATLALLNLWMGITRLRQWKRWRLWIALLLITYAFIAMRIVEITAMIHLGAK